MDKLKSEQLILGPFQGQVACQTIAFGRGVCGAAAKEVRTQLVPDVEAFPGHIACDSASRSEIVVPIVQNGKVSNVFSRNVRSLIILSIDGRDHRHRLRGACWIHRRGSKVLGAVCRLDCKVKRLLSSHVLPHRLAIQQQCRPALHSTPEH